MTGIFEKNVIPSHCNNFQVQIQNKKVDLSKVTSKCGFKDNINHKPGKRLIFMMTVLYRGNICTVYVIPLTTAP